MPLGFDEMSEVIKRVRETSVHAKKEKRKV